MGLENAIEDSYDNHINDIYKILSEAILLANGDETEITTAESKFKKGLAHAEDIRLRARRLAGLD
ncbi:hypothetical protein [Agaribacterium sp. ZY112]|uniref:hypothetical protein n=1 Tax=Agaribacterium sp. ZY112 TaxID=3233574 RepID=UPI0035241321